jgi:hypothetical protein
MVVRQKNIFGSLSSQKIHEFEQKYNIILPVQYREFLNTNNVCTIFPKDFNSFDGKTYISAIHGKLYGLDAPEIYNIENFYNKFPNIFFKKYLPIGQDYKDNHICIGIDGCNYVYYCRHDLNDEFMKISPSFTAFINNLYRFKRWDNWGREEKLYCDIEDDLPNEVEKHLNTWLPLDFIFDDTGWGLMETAVMNASYAIIKLFHSKKVPVRNALCMVWNNYFNNPDCSGTYEFKETYHLMKKLYNDPEKWPKEIK